MPVPTLSDAQARVTASQWHDGQTSALYALSSSGAIVAGVDSELSRAIGEAERFYGPAEADRLRGLLRYVEDSALDETGYRAPVVGWSALWDSAYERAAAGDGYPPDRAEAAEAEAEDLPPITSVWSQHGHTFMDDGDGDGVSCLVCGAHYQLVRRADDPSAGDYVNGAGAEPVECSHDTGLSHGEDMPADSPCNCDACRF